MLSNSVAKPRGVVVMVVIALSVSSGTCKTIIHEELKESDSLTL
jgi:hypothetical protein